MKKITLGIMTASCLIFNFQAHAQDDAPYTFNFAQALETASSHDQDLQAAEFAYQSSVAGRGLSKAALLPQLNFSTFVSHTESKTENSSNALISDGTIDFDTEGYNLSLSQSLYNHSLYKKLQQTDMAIASATATVEAARQDLVVRLATAYFNALGAQDNLKFATAEKEAIGKQLEQSQKRFEVGLIAITDVKEAQASYDTSVAQEIDAQNILAAQFEALAVILGTYTTSIAAMKEDIPLLIPEPASMIKWTESAEQNNLALKAAQFNYQASQKQVDADQSEHYPYLDLVAQHNYNSPDGGRFSYSDSTDTDIRVQLTIPIYSGGFTSSKHKQSVALKEQARSLKEKAKRQTQQQTRDAYLGVTSTIAQVKALKQALLSTQAAHEATQAGFEVGTRTAIDVLSTLREVYRAERDYARARYNYVINTLRLKQAAGTLSMEDGQNINAFLQ
ncbi:MAG: type I secretion protein TolC [endosymbiont of Galathealinum brachiosum]|uniref:Type I secretion protein TolC n=1 Tax=endosymbiont of Galathealinum brachiosum TaxID=2200906 RepID=A0A370DB12_9GAMM|nr:MAG: type I secretion protein TolC [endosymbiont of Galathealinum brachiosum]